jgi:hypothetical protein
MTIRPIALLALAALLLPTVTHPQGPVAVPGTADVVPCEVPTCGSCYDAATCKALVAAIDAARPKQPDMRTLNKVTDPGTVIGSVSIRADDDGVTRWHVGVIGGPVLSSVEPSPAAQSRIRAEFAKKSTAPVVFDGGYGRYGRLGAARSVN